MEEVEKESHESKEIKRRCLLEHAFMIDYGLKRADYVEAFFKNIDWATAEARLK